MNAPQIVGVLALGLPLLWWFLLTDSGKEVAEVLLELVLLLLGMSIVVTLAAMVWTGQWWPWSS